MSWEQLLSIKQEAIEAAREDERNTAAPVACPNDGEPLKTGPGGQLECPFDGWRP